MDEKLWAIAAIMVLGVMSLWLGHDGFLVAACVTGIAGLAGVSIKQKP